MLLEDGQSRRIVEDGPTMAVVVTGVVGSADVGVGVVDDEPDCDEAEDCAAPALFVVLCLFEASAPPTPPPTAATIMMARTMNVIQKVLFLRPHIVLGWSCS